VSRASNKNTRGINPPHHVLANRTHTDTLTIMKACLTVPSAIAIMLLSASPATADTRPVIWNTAAWRADNGQNTAWLWGVGLNAPIGSDLRAEASYQQGQFNQGGDLEENDEVLAILEAGSSWWYAGLGFSYLGFRNELRRGFVWSYPEEEVERNADIYGPAIRFRAETPLGSPSIGIAGYTVLMPYDFGDLDDVGYNGRYLELGGECFWQLDRVRLAGGYRFRHFNDVPRRIINDVTYPRDDIDGFTLSVSFEF